MKRILFLFPLLISFLQAQTAPVVDVSAEPMHHVVFQNDYVRILKVEVPPHTASLLHRHDHDYIYISLGDAHIASQPENKPEIDITLKAGEARFSPGNFAHVTKNLGDQPFHVIAVELLQPQTSRWPEDAGEKTFPGGSSKILFVKDGVRVSEVNLAPGGVIPSHHHDGPHLVIALTDLDLRSDVSGEGSTHGTLRAGDFTWIQKAYTHTLTNAGNNPARFITMEFQK